MARVGGYPPAHRVLPRGGGLSAVGVSQPGDVFALRGPVHGDAVPLSVTRSRRQDRDKDKDKDKEKDTDTDKDIATGTDKEYVRKKKR